MCFPTSRISENLKGNKSSTQVCDTSSGDVAQLAEQLVCNDKV